MNRTLAASVGATLLVIAAVSPFATAGFTATDTADPPSVTTNHPSDVTDEEATLRGRLDDLGNATNASVSFEYWLEGDPENASTTSPVLLEAPDNFTATVDELRENATYVVVARANASNDESATGDQVTFNTTGGPSVTTESPSAIEETSATLRGRLDDLGGAENATVWFEYWVQGDPANETTTDEVVLEEPADFDASVSDLDANETYVAETSVVASDGDDETGFEVPFTTEPDLAVETGDPEDVSRTEATLTGTVLDLGDAENATVGFEYWRADDPDDVTTTEEIEVDDTGDYRIDVDDLESGTTYEVVAVADASDGDEATGETVSFTTASPSSDDLSIGISQGAARVTIAVTHDEEPVEDATVTITNGDDYPDDGSHTTDQHGTVALSAPTSKTTVTIEAVSDGHSGSRTVTLHAQEGHGPPFTPFGQRVSAFVDSLLLGDVSGPLGHHVASFVVHAHPDHGQFGDGDDKHRWGPERGPPDHAKNDDRGPWKDSDDDDGDDEEREDSDEKDWDDDDDDEDDDDEGEDDEDDDDDGPPEHARNDDHPGRGH